VGAGAGVGGVVVGVGAVDVMAVGGVVGVVVADEHATARKSDSAAAVVVRTP
jgi:hypothetical protein